MKKLFIILTSLILCLFITPVSALEQRIFVDGDISEFFLEGDYQQLEEDLQHIKDSYNIDIRFSISVKKDRTDSSFHTINTDIDARHVVILEVGTDGGGFYAGGPLADYLYDNSDVA